MTARITTRPDQRPTLTEAAAVMAAVQAYSRALHFAGELPAEDLPRLLDELERSIERMRAVTRDA